MPSKEVQEDLIIVISELRHNELGEKFMKAFGAYSAMLTKELIQSPLDQAQVRLGIARQADVLLEMFKDAPDEARKILAARESAKIRRNS